MAADGAGCRGGSDPPDVAGVEAGVPELPGGRAWGWMPGPLYESRGDAPGSTESRHPVALP
eukprot:9918376-Heterocapsa_arctica.AAC.1